MQNEPIISGKSLAVTTLLGVLLTMGHAYLLVEPLPMYVYLRIAAGSILALLCIAGIIMLSVGNGKIRSRRVFSITLAFYAIASLGNIAMRFTHPEVLHSPTPQLLSPAIVIYGNVFAYLFLLYPIALLHVGKMTLWHYLRLLFPALASGLFYYGVVYAFDIEITRIDSWRDMVQNIGAFEVWFRFVIFAYPIWMMVRISRMKKRYEKWCADNYSDSAYIDLGWINYYFYGFFLLLCSYMVLVLSNNPQNMLLHVVTFIAFFGYALYHIMRQKAPTSQMFDETLDDRSTDDDEESAQERDPSNPSCFENRIPEYKLMLEEWMQREKPYHDKDFKLLDVMSVLPLNRTYLSRMFNEVYGETFLSFVMRYRIEESSELLISDPDLPIASVAQECGFSSPSVFARAFQRAKGVTPTEFRMHQIHNTMLGSNA